MAICFTQTHFTKRLSPTPSLGLGLEITKELWEVIITVISSQKRRPPLGRGVAASSGGEGTHTPARLAGGSLADLFFVRGLSRDRGAGPSRKSVSGRFSLMSFLCLHVEGQRKKGDGKRFKTNKYKNKKQKHCISPTVCLSGGRWGYVRHILYLSPALSTFPSPTAWGFRDFPIILILDFARHDEWLPVSLKRLFQLPWTAYTRPRYHRHLLRPVALTSTGNINPPLPLPTLADRTHRSQPL